MKCILILTLPYSGSVNRSNWLKQFDLSTLTQKELNLCGDYILYGDEQLYKALKSSNKEKIEKINKSIKESTFFSGIDKDSNNNTSDTDENNNNDTSALPKDHHIFLTSKFTDFKGRRKIYSLDALMENPIFHESQLDEHPEIYKYIKPHLNKEKFKTIPEAKSLLEEIEKMEKTYNEETDKSKKYFLRHWLISLRSQQYIIYDGYFPTIKISTMTPQKTFIPHCYFEMEYPILPRGVAKSPQDEEFLDPFYTKEKIKPYSVPQEGRYFDFTNYKHIRALYSNLIELQGQADNDIESPLKNLIYTLKIYEQLTSLKEEEKFILNARIEGKNNDWIVSEFYKKFKHTHQDNYFSTLYTNICRKIAKTAKINYEQALYKNDVSKWKECRRCGQLLLNTADFYMRDRYSSDGLKNICKKCDKEMRLAREAKKRGRQNN